MALSLAALADVPLGTATTTSTVASLPSTLAVPIPWTTRSAADAGATTTSSAAMAAAVRRSLMRAQPSRGRRGGKAGRQVPDAAAAGLGVAIAAAFDLAGSRRPPDG